MIFFYFNLLESFYFNQRIINNITHITQNIYIIRDMGIAGLNLKFNKKAKTNVERESIFIIKSHQTGPQLKKIIFSDDKLQRLNK